MPSFASWDILRYRVRYLSKLSMIKSKTCFEHNSTGESGHILLKINVK